jgi:hypothetical protein
MSFLGNHNSKTGKVKFVGKQENCNKKAAAKPHNTELPRQSTAASNPKNTRATKEKKEKNSRRRKEGDQNYIPSNTALAASADGTGHLHELFLVHGGQRWRVACARKESSHRQGEKCSRSETRVTGPVSLVEPGPDCGPSSSCNHCNPDSEPVLVPKQETMDKRVMMIHR